MDWLSWPDGDSVEGTSRIVSLNPSKAERREQARRQLRTMLTGAGLRCLLDIACARQHRVGEVWATAEGPVYVARIRYERIGCNAVGEARSVKHEQLIYVDDLSDSTSWLEHPDRLPAGVPLPERL
ncbi:hypothetical protein [Nonomuraea typhae]|uniref:hypothetical protein n=1 Tax=Nonomuraea typhae TaxID=2603600 RepID=UPI0012FA06C5|nr:hypothetical protein [Nonomuraea typhae]